MAQFFRKCLLPLTIAFASNTSETMSTSPYSVSLGSSSSLTPFNLFRQPGQPRKSRMSQKKITPRNTGIFEQPQLYSTPHSDRVAILDKDTGSYCAYSLLESINKNGLSQREALDWVAGRLVIKKKISSDKAMQVLCMIGLSWGAAAFGVWSLVQLLF